MRLATAGSGISGEPYVHWDNEKKKWRVEIWRGNLRFRFGRFNTVEAAARVARYHAQMLDNEPITLTPEQERQRRARLKVEGRKELKRIMREGKKKAVIKRSNKQLYKSQHKSL